MMTGEKTPELHSISLLGQSYRNFDKGRDKLEDVFRSENKDQCLIRRRKTSLTTIKAIASIQEIR